MLRRQLAAPSRDVLARFHTPRRQFFGAFGGKKNNSDGAAAGNNTAPPNAAGGAGPFGGFPGIDMQKMRAMEQLFRDQPPEKQEEMMKQALEFQKTMSKIPGFGKLAQKNTEMMEQLLKAKQGEPAKAAGTFGGTTAKANARNMREMFVPPTPPPSSNTGSSNTNNTSNSSSKSSGKGPTLDELKKINLGPEIEALFDELRVMRNKKNEYRDKYNKTKSALDTLQSEATQLRSTEASLRDKLKRTEQEVMLLTSENMQLQEAQSKLKDLTNEKTQLQRSLRTAEEALKSSNAAGTPQYDALVQRLQSKEESLRSLQRKVDRLRRRDPLLQFSLACSELHRLCPVDAEASAQDAGREEAEAAYQLLSEQYSGAQTEAWKSASSKGSVAAKAYLAAARHAVAASVPLSYYDAAIVIEGNVGEATTLLESFGYITESTPEDPSRLQVKAPSTAGVLTGPGPYGYLLALRYAKSSSFTIQSVHPIVSSELVENAQRCNVTYETARASGPGGQATNVTETQVYAKLTIDGRFAYTAEAQDSRSALNNKDAALEKLKQTKRLHYNDSLARKYRPEEVVATIVQRVKESGGLEVEDSYLQLVQDAVSEKTVSVLDGALAQFVAHVAKVSKQN